jgi:hypothetical protein
VPDELSVHVNHDGLYTLSVPDSFEATGPFDVRIVNHGGPVHVHLHLKDPLSRVATLDATNHHLDAESERVVGIDVNTDALDVDALDAEGLRGGLKVAAGHGTETRWVDLTLMTPEAAGETVRVGESLAEPQPRDEVSLADYPQLLVLALAAVAVGIAAAVALALDAMLVLGGALVVLGGVLLALLLLARGLLTPD